MKDVDETLPRNVRGEKAEEILQILGDLEFDEGMMILTNLLGVLVGHYAQGNPSVVAAETRNVTRVVERAAHAETLRIDEERRTTERRADGPLNEEKVI